MIILAGKVRVEIMRRRFRAKKESCSAITAYIRITREQGTQIMGRKKNMTDKINTKESVHDQIMMSSFVVVQTEHSQIGRIREVNGVRQSSQGKDTKTCK